MTLTRDNLLGAIAAGDTEKVREILSENPNFCRKEGVIGLPFCKEAAALGHHEIVELLIKSGEDSNTLVFYTDESTGVVVRCTLLHLMAEYASPCQENHIKIGEILIRLGADFRARDHDKRTPLEYAFERGNMDWAEFLLKNGAKIDDLNLRWVFDNVKYRKDALKLLFKHGLDPEIEYGYERNLFDLFGSCLKKDRDDVAEVMRLLVNSGVPNQKLSMHWAVDTDNIQIVKFLIDERGVEVEGRYGLGCSPLNFAVQYKSLEMVDFLLSRGADVNLKSTNGISPLMWAVMNNKKDITMLLISSGADVNAKNTHGATPLHYACHRCNSEIIDLLVQKGADVSIEEKQGRTALYALTKSSDECLIIVMKQLARLSFEEESILEKDVNLIQKNPRMRNLFEESLTELKEMSDARFYGIHTYYAVLKMSKNLRKLAKLMKNEEFVEKFEANLDRFTHYQSDLRRIFEDAKEVKNKLEALYEKLKSIFRDYLPDIVIRKLVDNLCLEDLPSE